MTVIDNKVSIYDLAKELKQDTKRIIEELRREGADISVPSNSVSKELAEKIRNRYFPKKEVAPVRTIKVIKKEKTAASPMEQETTKKPNRKKGFVHPNTIWVKEHHAKYAGKYVALENGELVSTGKSYPDALANAKKNGVQKPMITYLPREDEELFGGW